MCDAHDFLYVDSRTVRTADGERTYDFVVIGNPCHDESKLSEEVRAPSRVSKDSSRSTRPGSAQIFAV